MSNNLSFDFAATRKDFPIFASPENQNLIYFDSAATAQKPRLVIDAISNYYQTHNANIHRGVYQLAEESTRDWDESRETIAKFLGADADELIVTRNATEAFNGVAYGWADHQLKPGDKILITLLEHHANLVPWQQVCQRTGAELLVAKVTVDDRLDEIDWLSKLQTPGVKLVTLTHVSNVTGAVLPIKNLVRLVHRHQPGARMVLDAAQSVPHLPMDFHQLGVDFLAFSGHKLYGPMGIGGLLVRRELLTSQEFQPWLFGGGMIESVWPDRATFSLEQVDRFTAGTPDVASLVGLAAATKYLQQIGMAEVVAHEQILVKTAYEKLSQIPEIQLIGPDPVKFDRVGSVAFTYQGIHAHDVAQVLASQNIAVRSGHHCAMPLHTAKNWSATTRVSFGIYNTEAEIDRFIKALAKVKNLLKHD
ncbi:MAG TPA: cysteine desulfurase [Candidatus Pacebacteria bacterium]|nr:cysteine desulfurase [Candidatus Paceibacterota bacterium]